MLDKRIL